MRAGSAFGRLVGMMACLLTVVVGPEARAETKSEAGAGASWEVGGFAETLFISRYHNLAAKDARAHYRFDWPALLVGGRGSYVGGKYWAAEAEVALGSGSVGHGSGGERTPLPPSAEMPSERVASSAPVFLPARLQLLGQVPAWRFVPFALVGVGVLYAQSTEMGADADLLLEMGVGTKFLTTERIAPRLDLRLDMTQREGGGLADGPALHGEILLGVGVTL